MASQDERVRYREVALPEIAPGGPLAASFADLVRPWRARGLTRWLELLRPDAALPVVVLGALEGAGAERLAGAIVGVRWHTALERFDDLFGASDGEGAAARPSGGVWHFISVTTTPGVRGLGVGRQLVKRGLSWARGQGAASAKTLSPAFGLPALVNSLAPAGAAGREVWRAAIACLCDARGRPCLPILGLHLGGGASLERVLFDSRIDDEASGAVTLRFAYAFDEGARVAQVDAYRRWVRARRAAVARGAATLVAGDPPRWYVPCDGPAAQVVFGEPTPCAVVVPS